MLKNTNTNGGKWNLADGVENLIVSARFLSASLFPLTLRRKIVSEMPEYEDGAMAYGNHEPIEDD
jgi:hypothetical protein